MTWIFALCPEQIVTSPGWPDIDALELTVSVAVAEVSFGEHVPETTARYRYPFSVVVAPDTERLFVVALAYIPPLDMVLQPDPLYTCQI